jgi:hypothetical protein
MIKDLDVISQGEWRGGVEITYGSSIMLRIKHFIENRLRELHLGCVEVVISFVDKGDIDIGYTYLGTLYPQEYVARVMRDIIVEAVNTFAGQKIV